MESSNQPPASKQLEEIVLPKHEELHNAHVNRYELEVEYKKCFDKNGVFDNYLLETIDPKFHNEIAGLLIESGKVSSVIENVSEFREGRFQGLNNEIVKLLIKKGEGVSVIKELEYFQGLDHNEIVHLLIENGEGLAVIKNLSKFQGLDHNEVVHLLIKNGYSTLVQVELSSFKGLNNETWNIIDKRGGWQFLTRNVSCFRGLNNEIVKQFIEMGLLFYVLENKVSFKDFDLFSYKEEIIKAFKKKGLNISSETFLDIFKNDRFGINLLTKFEEFDDAAKSAVNKVLEIEEEIDKSVDRRSTEYRVEAQEQLLDFGRNDEILERLEESDVDTEVWLSYDKVSYFELGNAENLSFGEKISHPVKRLPEAMKAYMTSIKNALMTYKKELENATFKEDISDLYTQMQSIELRILQEKDEKKKSGMRKGLSVLQERTGAPKQIRIWDKLHAEIAKLHFLADDIVKENNDLIELEKNKITVVDDESSKQAIAQKQLTWKKQKDLVTDITKLHRRINDIFDVYEKTLSSSLGKERAEGIVNQIQNEVKEHIDHLRTDFDTIFTFTDEHLSEEGVQVNGVEVEDDDEYKGGVKDVKSLEGRPMSIRIGGRSRQDLYLGNYTTCCIRIDSEYHEEECPIADYVTDLGMQNVVVYDEVTKTPVACAWCWIGGEYDVQDGEFALVIDNVEGWQKYTVNFKKQLEEKLREYLMEYAKAIGVKKLSQGPYYNDLDVIEKDEQVEKYLKIGAYNRGSGYYLEAETDYDNGVGDEYDEFLDDEE